MLKKFLVFAFATGLAVAVVTFLILMQEHYFEGTNQDAHWLFNSAVASVAFAFVSWPAIIAGPLILHPIVQSLSYSRLYSAAAISGLLISMSYMMYPFWAKWGDWPALIMSTLVSVSVTALSLYGTSRLKPTPN